MKVKNIENLPKKQKDLIGKLEKEVAAKGGEKETKPSCKFKKVKIYHQNARSKVVDISGKFYNFDIDGYCEIEVGPNKQLLYKADTILFDRHNVYFADDWEKIQEEKFLSEQPPIEEVLEDKGIAKEVVEVKQTIEKKIVPRKKRRVLKDKK